MEARRRVGPVLALSPYLLVGVLPFITHDPHDFTNRGLIWMKSIEWWHRNPFFGLGSDWYARVGATGDRLASSVFNGHNQLIHLLVTGGLVLVILVAVQLVVAAWRSGVLAASGHNVGVAYLATLAATGILEKSLVIVDNTSMFPVVVLPLAILMCGDYTPRLQKRRAETDELTPGPLEYEGAGTR
jgi:O-antigen ligase